MSVRQKTTGVRAKRDWKPPGRKTLTDIKYEVRRGEKQNTRGYGSLDELERKLEALKV